MDRQMDRQMDGQMNGPVLSYVVKCRAQLNNGGLDEVQTHTSQDIHL